MRGQEIRHAESGGHGPPDRQAGQRGHDGVTKSDPPARTGDGRTGGRRSHAANALGWKAAGLHLVTASVVCCIVMQAVWGQWFPPPISMSQYGVGPWGWIFSAWAITIALGPVCLERAVSSALSRRMSLARWLLTVGAAGSLVMAVVRTQEGGAQQTWNAKVHTVGSIAALTFLPLGILAVVWWMGPRWRLWAAIIVGLITASLLLLLLAASGVDSAGLGPSQSWAFWQTIAIVLCQVLTVVMAWATRWLAAGARAP
jgi:Protein of unknown function (DUF998)